MKNTLDEAQDFANDLLDFISYSPSTYHVVRNIKAALLRKGFKELLLNEEWSIEKEGKYFVSQNDTTIAAFVIGMGDPVKDGFRIVSAHTDSPCLKVKPNPELLVENSYLKLNTEVYGGAILSSWFDTPLSIAGRVIIKSKDIFNPEIRQINFKKPILTIPSLCIHFNRNANKGVEINPQQDINPILCNVNSVLQNKNYLINLIAKELNVSSNSILDYDLQLYDVTRGCLVGANQEFISSPKIDNLSMIHAGMEGLFTSKISNATQMMVCYDNEEVGSTTKQGAASPFLKNVLERIIYKLNLDKEEYIRSIYNSFMISADPAHALHPNYQNVSCPSNHPIINKGPVVKYNANQKYTTDGISAAIFNQIAQKAGVNTQSFTNRSDIAGGSTLGSIATTITDMKCVDVGTPMLAMHSRRELCGVYDHWNIKNIFKEFFEC